MAGMTRGLVLRRRGVDARWARRGKHVLADRASGVGEVRYPVRAHAPRVPERLAEELLLLSRRRHTATVRWQQVLAGTLGQIQLAVALPHAARVDGTITAGVGEVRYPLRAHAPHEDESLPVYNLLCARQVPAGRGDRVKLAPALLELAQVGESTVSVGIGEVRYAVRAQTPRHGKCLLPGR